MLASKVWSAARRGVVTTIPRVLQGRCYSTGGAFPAYLLNTPPTKVTKLSNGLRVATEESPGETATVGLFVDAGSAYESDKTNGVAHFLEHMAFKGTTSRTREGLEVEVENAGASLNAYTSREQTVYIAKVFKGDVQRAVSILSDIVQNSRFDESHVEAERGTILREMQEVGKDYGEVIIDALHSAAFQSTPLGRTILGPAENVKRLTRDELIAYIRTHYTAPRMVLAGAGAVSHAELVGLAEGAFKSLPSSSGSGAAVDEKPQFTGAMVTVRDDTMEEAHVAIGFESVGWAHADYYVFMLVQTLLGSWDRTIGGGRNLASKLCESIATDNLARSVSAFNTTYKHTGICGVYGVVDDAHHGNHGKRLEDYVFQVMHEFNRLGKNVTAAEVERAKQKLKAAVLMQLDGTTAQCEDIGRQLLTYGRRLSPAETILRIDAITVKDVMRVVREHFEDVDPAVAAIGPLYTFPDYNQIRGWTYWNRF